MKISIIVPVYKTEKFLDRCMYSLINQTYSDIEIILVDDGSPDNCGTICDNYAKSDSRIKVVHKTNGGLSSARNAGLEVAVGEYIVYVDSDDDISLDFCRKMMDVILDTSADIVECDRFDVYDSDDIYDDIGDGKVNLYEPNKALELLIKNKIFHQTVWAKLYKTEVIKGLLFEFGKIHEDEFYTWQAFVKSKSIAHLNLKLYNYYHREGSIMEQKFSLSRLDAVEARIIRHEFICQNITELSLESKLSIAFPCILMTQRLANCEDKALKREALSKLKNYFKRLKFTYKEIKSLNLNEKVWIVISIISLRLCANIRNILKRPC